MIRPAEIQKKANKEKVRDTQIHPDMDSHRRSQ